MWPKGLLALPCAVGGRTHAIIQAQTHTHTSPFSPHTHTDPFFILWVPLGYHMLHVDEN